MIKEITAIEILDSRGRPTLKARCALQSGAVASASVPSGASTGKAEAYELRDGDPDRFEGLGCLKAVSNVNEVIHAEVVGKNFGNQRDFDETLIALDGTEKKKKLGANSILACSMAFARATSIENNLPLYQYFGGLIGNDHFTLPRPTINLFSGGKHAGGQVAIQDLLVVPLSATTLSGALSHVYAVYQAASRIILEKYHARNLTADEGGLAPPFQNTEEMFKTAIEAIEQAGLQPGKDIALAVDVASSQFYEGGRYHIDGRQLNSIEMIGLIKSWVNLYPILSVEDGLSEDDWVNWPELKRAIGQESLVLGDDLLCTTVSRIKRAIDMGAANALLLKVNQCGTITEASEAFQLAKKNGFQVSVSARSGETEDDWLADLAVGWGGNQIKIGSITQSERLAKYNRMLEMEYFDRLPIRKWDGLSAGNHK